MRYVKLIVVVLLAGCLGGLWGRLLAQGQHGAADSDTRVRFIPADNRVPGE